MTETRKPKGKIQKRVDRVRRFTTWAYRNVVNGVRIARELKAPRFPVSDLTRYERRFRSQYGEDGLLQAIFRILGTTDRYCVEFGVGSGRECNTAHLVGRRGWTGLWMDGKVPKRSTALPVRAEFITAENIVDLFRKYNVPAEFDLLSIDIDGNDYWIWKKLSAYRPRVLVVEYNASIPPTEAKVMPYDPSHVWDKTDYYGASLLAFEQLGRSKGYSLVACESYGNNAFFVRDDVNGGCLLTPGAAALYRPPRFHGGKGHIRNTEKSLVDAPQL
jgi:hypothetical protein